MYPECIRQCLKSLAYGALRRHCLEGLVFDLSVT